MQVEISVKMLTPQMRYKGGNVCQLVVKQKRMWPCTKHISNQMIENESNQLFGYFYYEKDNFNNMRLNVNVFLNVAY